MSKISTVSRKQQNITNFAGKINMIEITQEWLFKQTRDFLAKGKKVIMRGRGVSMHPYLRPGVDAVVLSPYNTEDLQPGLIVLFYYHGNYLLHRIIGRKGKYYIMQGDGVWRGKETVQEQDIIAVVWTVIRSGGKEVSTQSPVARWYWICWRRLRPIRRYLLWIYRIFY